MATKSKQALTELEEIYYNYYQGVKEGFDIINDAFNKYRKECKEFSYAEDDECPCINSSAVDEGLKKISKVAEIAYNKYNDLCDRFGARPVSD